MAQPTARRMGAHALSVHLLAALALGAAGLTAQATTLSWNNAAGGSASTATNWLPVQVPTAADDLLFNLSATYAVTFNNIVPNSLSHTYRNGTITLIMSSPHTASAGITAGDLNGDNVIVTLTTGSWFADASVVVGDAAGSTGRINVNDDDAVLTVDNGADLTIGSNGAGTLSITGSGEVDVADQFIVGSNASSVSTVTVSGSQVAPIASSFLDVLGMGQSRVGQGGDVTMTVDTGALARFAGDLIIANGSASTSSLTVQTAGPLLNARLVVDGNLLIGRNSGSPAAGNGTLNINTGGTATVGDTTFLGDPDGGTGTLHLGGGTFDGTVIDVLAGSTINGTGTINSAIANDGNIQPSGAAGLTITDQLANGTNNIVGTKIHFGSGGSYFGSGSCQTAIGGDATALITATGDLTMGNNTTAGFSHLGTLSTGGHTVTLVDSNGAVLGGLTNLDGGRVLCTTGIGIQNGAEVRGQGTLQGAVVNAGRIQPVGYAPSGVITIQGNLIANPTSVIDVEIAGPGVGTPRVLVTGTATFGGTARVTLAPGYLPTIGEQIILVNAAGGRTGTFAALDHTLLCDQYTLVLVYSSTAAIALIRPGTQVTAVGDIDRDGDVDADDFIRWAPCMAGPDVLVPPSGCDPDDFHYRDDLDGPACTDYDVDVHDLAVLQRIM